MPESGFPIVAARLQESVTLMKAVACEEREVCQLHCMLLHALFARRNPFGSKVHAHMCIYNEWH